MKYTLLRVSLKDCMRLTLALANEPSRPTLTQDNQTETKEYLDLIARVQKARKTLEEPTLPMVVVENGAKSTKQTS